MRVSLGATAVEQDSEPFEEKMRRLTAELERQFAEGARLDEAIRRNMASLGFAMKRPRRDCATRGAAAIGGGADLPASWSRPDNVSGWWA
jgi:hypothetical protein